MTLRIQCVAIHCLDIQRVASFWQAALAWRRTYDTETEVVLEPPAGSPQDGVSPDLIFLPVPERQVDVGQGDDVSWVLRAFTPAELDEISRSSPAPARAS